MSSTTMLISVGPLLALELGAPESLAPFAVGAFLVRPLLLKLNFIRFENSSRRREDTGRFSSVFKSTFVTPRVNDAYPIFHSNTKRRSNQKEDAPQIGTAAVSLPSAALPSTLARYSS